MLEDRVPIAPVLEVVPGHRHGLARPRRLAEDKDAVDVRIGEGPQQNGVEHIEDRRRRADTERERQHDDSRESRILSQRTRGVAHVVPGAADHGRSSLSEGHRFLRRLPLHLSELLRHALVDFSQRLPIGGRVADTAGAQLVVPILQMLRELVDDFGFAHRRQVEPGQSPANFSFPVAHVSPI